MATHGSQFQARFDWWYSPVGARSCSSWWLLIAAISIVLLVGGTLIAQSESELRELKQQRSMLDQSRKTIDALYQFVEHLSNIGRVAGEYFRTGQAVELEPLPTQKNLAQAVFDKLPALIRNEQDRRQYQQLADLYRQHLEMLDDLLAVRSVTDGVRSPEFNAVLGEGTKLQQQLMDSAQSWREQKAQELRDADVLTDSLIATRELMQRSVVFAVLLSVGLLLAIARNLWRQQRLQEGLDMAVKTWHGTFDSLTQGVALYNIEHHLLLWNRQYARLHGVDPEVLFAGMTRTELAKHSRLFQNSGVQAELRNLEAVMQQLSVSKVYEHESSDEQGVTIRAEFRIMDDSHYVVMLSDLTAMRAFERAEQDQATRVRAIMDHVPDAIITISDSGTIESWNERAEQLFGYATEQALGRNVKMLMPEDEAARHDLYLQRYGVVSERKSAGAAMELQALHQTGRVIPVELRVGSMQIAGERKFIGVVRDMTQQRVVENMKREFVSVVSHELRTPLTSILGSLSLLPQAIAKHNGEQIQRLLSLAENNGQRLAALVNDILDLDKAESGHLQMNVQQHDLYAVLQSAVEANRGYAARFGVVLNCQAETGEYPVRIDEGRILQVLANLLSNAIKYSPEGGQVLVVLQRLERVARVTVHDDGPGIAEAFQTRVFDKFAQADGSDVRRQAGTGLGLAITKSLVELHDGRIGFDSGKSVIGLGQGASFWFELPCCTV